MQPRRLLSALLSLAFFAAMVLGFSLLAESVQAAQAKPLQYKFKKDQKFGYNVKICVDLPTTEKTYEGMISYDTENAKTGRLKCTGGLTVKMTYKETDDNLVTLSRIHRTHPFSSIDYFGNFSNKIEIAPDGKTLKVKGTKHFPFLLGDISTLVFERLDKTRQDTWTIKRDMAVSEVSMFSRGFAPFMRGGFEIVSSANETQTFKLLKKREDGLLDFTQTYRFETLCDEGKFILAGKGVWTFDPELGLSESLKMKYELIEEKSNISVKIPLKVEYTRISDKAMAEYVKKKKEEAEESKKQNKKHMSPVTAEDEKQYIKALTSGVEEEQKKALNELRMWRPAPNAALAKAIRPLTEGNPHIAFLAKSALKKFCIKTILEEAYGENRPLDDKLLGRPIRKETKLPKGLIVAARKDWPKWYKSAQVVQALGNHEYYVKFTSSRMGRREEEKEVVPWSHIRLAPPELDQLNVKKADLKELYDSLGIREGAQSAEIAAMKDFRTWTDNTGTFQIVAKYISSDEKSVELQKKDDSKLKVPLKRLSEKDRKVVEQLRSLPSNPFE